MIETSTSQNSREVERKIGSSVFYLALFVCLAVGAWGLGRYMRPAEKTKVSSAPRTAAPEKYDVAPGELPTDRRSTESLLVVPESRGETLAWTPAAAADSPSQEAAVTSVAKVDSKEEMGLRDAMASKRNLTPSLSPNAGGYLNGGSGMFGGVSRAFGGKLGETKTLPSSKSPG